MGLEIAISSIKAFSQELEPPKGITIFAVVLSIVVKEGMFQYKFRLGKRVNSDAIIANAYEHRSDVFSSIAALIGICAAIIGGKLGIDWLVYADPIAGLVVSLLVVKMAWSIGAEAIHATLDHVLHEEDVIPLREAVLQVDGVKKLVLYMHGSMVIMLLSILKCP